MKRLLCVAFTAVLCSQVIAATRQPQPDGIAWVDWTADLFQRAKSEKKLVILDLEAVWCHWCHVMEEKTYSDPRVKKRIRDSFIAVRVDQDARPDLSRRYEDYGWPATIFFASDGTELAKRSGFQTPDEMDALLKRLVERPTPEEGSVKRTHIVPESPFLKPSIKKELVEGHGEQYGDKTGGWGSIHKFLFGYPEEWALREAWRGNKLERKRATVALTKALALIDPVWGGAYQYSVKTWNEPHFEKIAEIQGRYLFLYSHGYLLTKDKNYLTAAKSIRKYLRDFLRSPEGAFYTSQDADLVPGQHSESYFRLGDKARRQKGIPAVDKHLYARENGWYITGLCAHYAATGDAEVLKDATTAAEWVMAKRALGGGGFGHDETDPGGPYLGDTLRMGEAFISLYEVTGDRKWLTHAMDAGAFIHRKFAHDEAGYLPYLSEIGPGLKAERIRDENIDVARFGNRLFRYSGRSEFQAMAHSAMRFVAIPDVATEYPSAGALLANEELSTAPVHLTIVGSKKDPKAKELFVEAIRYPVSYRRVEWFDREEGDLPNQDVKYPVMKQAAAFACTDGRCSLPVFVAKELGEKVSRLYK